jgi:hypothetical protein
MFMTYESDHIWWNWISNPSRVLNAILADLSEQRAVVLTGAIPWEAYFRACISTTMQDDNHIIATLVDGKRFDAANAGEALLEQFGAPDVENNYRPGMGGTVSDYLRANGVLNGRLIWVRDVPMKSLSLWTAFLKEYLSKSYARDMFEGLFILTCAEDERGEYATKKHGERIAVYHMAREIDFYDVFSFAMMSFREKSGGGRTLKQYSAWCAAFCFRRFVELVPLFLREVSFSENMLDALSHFFARHNLKMDAKQLENYIWQAQIRVFFPIIETLRVKLVEKYSGELTVILHSTDVQWHEQKIDNLYDVELGLLVYFAHYYKNETDRLLYLPDGDYACLMLLYDCRNMLAHLKVIPSEGISGLVALDSNPCLS